LKALAIYRDGSKEIQPLSTKKRENQAEKVVGGPRRERLPDTRQSVTHKFSVSGHEGYITVGLYPDGRPGEMFITMAKEGSTVGGMMDCFGTSISMGLQYGVPLEVYVEKFSHTRFEPMGYTKNPDIRLAKSIVDYIFRWLGITFLSQPHEDDRENSTTPVAAAENSAEDGQAERRPAATKAGGPDAGHGTAKTGGSNGASKKTTGSNGTSRRKGDSATVVLERVAVASQSEAAAGHSARSEQFAEFQADAPACDNCGAIAVRTGNCYLCHNCGNSMGCS